MHSQQSSTVDLAREVFSRILLIKPSSLGDIVHALPVLHGLRVRYPEACINWLVSSSCAPLIADHPDLDEVLLFDRRRFGRLGRSLSATRAFLEFLRELRSRHYDLVIDLQGLFRSGFLAWASRARVRLGFAAAREASWLFYTHRLAPSPTIQHAVEKNYSVAGVLGFADVPIKISLPLAEADHASAASLLREARLSDESPFVAVVPGTRWETKLWSTERFAETVNAIQDGENVPCVLLGGPEEVMRGDAIAKGCRNRPINLTGRTNLRQLTAILERAALVLTQDSAAAHLAAALDRPLVCLIGPTNPNRTGPYRRNEDVIRLDLHCAPCYLRRLSQCGYQHRCMRDLSTELVVTAVRERLRAASPAGR